MVHRLAPLICLALLGCSRKTSSVETYDYGGGYEDEVRYEAVTTDSRKSSSILKKSKGRSAPAAPPPPPPPPPPAMVADESYMEPAPPMEPEPDEPAQAERMIHYDGFAQIRTPRGEELVEKVIALAEGVEGSIETRSLQRVTVRVPVARFDEVWKAVLELGPVVSRNLGAEDVTDAFTDLDLRLQSMKATRDRLNELLATEAELEERVRLLKEVHRLNSEITVMEAQLRVLADLASMSRITVVAVAPDLRANATRSLPFGMTWIDGLSAFDHRLAYEGRPVRIPVPEGFVQLDPPRYHVQAADGAVVWATSRKNDPQGSAAFWRDAVIDRIGEQLEDGSTTEVGGWSMVRFVEPGAQEPYVWHLAFRVVGNRLEILQATYPDEQQEQRYHQAVLSVLRGGEA